MRTRSKRVPTGLLAVLAAFTTVASAHALMTEAEAERAAERAFRQMKAQIPISRDAEARAYVDCVARSIIAQLDEPYRSMEWEIELFERRGANAFAMPGGKIGVYTGLLRVADNQDRLATVIGHEVAHVTGKHSLKRARKQIRNQLFVAAASGIIGGGSRTSDALSLGAELGLNRPYDRKQELEADVEGLELMAAAGFDPREGIQLWKNMAKQGGGSPPEFLSTHPADDNRIDSLISHLVPSLVAYNEAERLGRRPQCR